MFWVIGYLAAGAAMAYGYREVLPTKGEVAIAVLTWPVGVAVWLEEKTKELP